MINDVFGEVSVWFYILPVLVYLAFQVYGSFSLSAQYFIPVRSSGSGAIPAVALTFDDGPIAGKTEKILDILKKHQASAAFFCIGHRVKLHTALVQRMHSEGHLLANHSYWHSKTFDWQSAQKILEELKNTDSAIQESTGVVPRFFRPPYGVTNPMVAAAVTGTSHVTIGWSVRSLDTVIKDSSKLMNRVTSRLKAGDIIVFHDFSDTTIEILPALLEHIGRLGLKIVRVDELLNEKGYV